MITGKPHYPMLEAEISKCGVRKKDIASALNITPRALSKKMGGSTDFWWGEVQIIHRMFPKLTIEQLFKKN